MKARKIEFEHYLTLWWVGWGYWGGGGVKYFFQNFYFCFLKYIITPKKGIFNFSLFLTLWCVAGAGDGGICPNFDFPITFERFHRELSITTLFCFVNHIKKQ